MILLALSVCEFSKGTSFPSLQLRTGNERSFKVAASLQRQSSQESRKSSNFRVLLLPLCQDLSTWNVFIFPLARANFYLWTFRVVFATVTVILRCETDWVWTSDTPPLIYPSVNLQSWQPLFCDDLQPEQRVRMLHSSVTAQTRPRTGQPGFDSRQNMVLLFCATSSRPTLRLTFLVGIPGLFLRR